MSNDVYTINLRIIWVPTGSPWIVCEGWAACWGWKALAGMTCTGPKPGIFWIGKVCIRPILGRAAWVKFAMLPAGMTVTGCWPCPPLSKILGNRQIVQNNDFKSLKKKND